MRDIDRRFGVAKGIFSRLSSIVRLIRRLGKCLYDKVSFLNAQNFSVSLGRPISGNRQNRPLSAGMPSSEAVGGPILPGNCQDQNHKRKFGSLLLHRIAASLFLPLLARVWPHDRVPRHGSSLVGDRHHVRPPGRVVLDDWRVERAWPEEECP